MKKLYILFAMILVAMTMTTTTAFAADTDVTPTITDPVMAGVIRAQIVARYGEYAVPTAKIEVGSFEPVLPTPVIPIPEELLANKKYEYDFVNIKREVSTFDLRIFAPEFAGYAGRRAFLYTDNLLQSAQEVWCFVDVSPCAYGAHGLYVIEEFNEPIRNKTRAVVIRFTPSGKGKELPETDARRSE